MCAPYEILKASEIDSDVISSCVGPIPPDVKTYLNLFLKRLTVSIMIFFLSGITLTSSTLIPNELSQVASVLVFVSFVLPDKISFPMIIMPAFMSFLFVIS